MQLLLQSDGVVDGAEAPEKAKARPKQEAVLVLLDSQRKAFKVHRFEPVVLLHRVNSFKQVVRDEADYGAAELKSRVRLRRHVTDVLRLGMNSSRADHAFCCAALRPVTVIRKCGAFTAQRRCEQVCDLTLLCYRHGFSGDSLFFLLRSVAEWMLSGSRKADENLNIATLDQADASIFAIETQALTGAAPKPVTNPESPQGPSSQILTIDDGGASSCVAASNPPRAATFLQRLLSACACGSRQGKVYTCYSRI